MEDRQIDVCDQGNAQRGVKDIRTYSRLSVHQDAGFYGDRGLLQMCGLSAIKQPGYKKQRSINKQQQQQQRRLHK
eukprot:scaffold23148_cov21-Tisochrysis_lutea.AAC.1